MSVKQVHRALISQPPCLQAFRQLQLRKSCSICKKRHLSRRCARLQSCLLQLCHPSTPTCSHGHCHRHHQLALLPGLALLSQQLVNEVVHTRLGRASSSSSTCRMVSATSEETRNYIGCGSAPVTTTAWIQPEELNILAACGLQRC
jgi:hypothetical protein